MVYLAFLRYREKQVRWQTAEWYGRPFENRFPAFVHMSLCVCECSCLHMHRQVVGVSYLMWAVCTLNHWATSSTPTRTLEMGPLFFPFLPHLSLSPPIFSLYFFFTFWFLFIVSRQSYAVLLSGFELRISQSGGTLCLTRQTRKQRTFPASFNFLLLLWDSLTLQHRLASASPSPPSDFWDNRTMLPCVDLTMHFT